MNAPVSKQSPARNSKKVSKKRGGFLSRVRLWKKNIGGCLYQQSRRHKKDLSTNYLVSLAPQSA